MTNTLEDINKIALRQAKLAHPILNKIKDHPELSYVQDSGLIKFGESRWNKYFVLETFYDLSRLYNVNTSNEISENKDMPREVKEFLSDTSRYVFGIN